VNNGNARQYDSTAEVISVERVVSVEMLGRAADSTHGREDKQRRHLHHLNRDDPPAAAFRSTLCSSILKALILHLPVRVNRTQQ
jgi:hypothetical protein